MSNRRNSGRNRSGGLTQNEFGALLEKLRREHETFTQDDLAAAIGKKKATISHYEVGRSFPDEAKARLLSEKFRSRELMEAWYRVNKQREQDKERKRAAKKGSGKFSNGPVAWFESLPRNNQGLILVTPGDLVKIISLTPQLKEKIVGMLYAEWEKRDDGEIDRGVDAPARSIDDVMREAEEEEEEEQEQREEEEKRRKRNG